MAKNLKKGSFANKMYKKGVARGIHTTAKYMFKDSKKLHRRARGIRRRG